LHEHTNEKIYSFADVPHLIKLIRTHFISAEFEINEQKITTEPIKLLLSRSNNTELTSLFKLTLQHIEYNPFLAQNVRLSVQLFSRSTANALHEYLADDQQSQQLAKFVLAVNNFFDVFNANHVSETQKLKSPYGKHLSEQNEALDNMYEVMSKLKKIGSKRASFPFVQEILISISALKSLYTDLREKYIITYIITHRISTDESTFSCMRSKQQDLGPLDAVYALKRGIFGISLADLKKGRNTVDATSEQFSFLLQNRGMRTILFLMFKL
jgi:hypothetical protein